MPNCDGKKSVLKIPFTTSRITDHTRTVSRSTSYNIRRGKPVTSNFLLRYAHVSAVCCEQSTITGITCDSVFCMVASDIIFFSRVLQVAHHDALKSYKSFLC